MDLDLVGWLVVVLAVICIGAAKGGLTMIGALAVPLLATVMNPVVAAGLTLPVFVISDIFGLIAFRGSYDKRVLAILMPATALGVGLGWLTAARAPEAAVTGLVGVIGLAFALNALLRRGAQRVRPARVGPGVIWGAITGFTSFVSHSGAPPYQAYVMPLGLSPAVFAGTTTVCFAWVNAVKLIPYWALGQINLSNLKLALILSIPAVISVFAAARLVRVMPQKLFYGFVTWALLLISVKLLWDAGRTLL